MRKRKEVRARERLAVAERKDKETLKKEFMEARETYDHNLKKVYETNPAVQGG